MTKQPVVCNEKSWAALMSVANARTAAKAREAELVLTRKDLDNRLDQLGAGRTSAHLEVSRDYVVTERSIDFERDRIKTLADQLEKIISEAIQGKFEFAEEVDAGTLMKRPSETDLFHKEPEPEPKPPDARPVGRPGKPRPGAPDASKGDGVDEHMNASVNELDCREDIKGKLVQAGMTKIGQVIFVIESKDGDLRGEASLTEKQDRDVRAAVKAFRSAHRKAAREVEGAAS